MTAAKRLAAFFLSSFIIPLLLVLSACGAGGENEYKEYGWSQEKLLLGLLRGDYLRKIDLFSGPKPVNTVFCAFSTC